MAINAIGARYALPVGARRAPAAFTSGQALRESLTQRRGESDTFYFARLARDVHLRMAFYWSESSDRVAFTDNWLLNIAGHFLTTYRRYEFVSPERALARGFGLCSQDANILFGELRRSGFQPTTILLPSHTVVGVSDRQGRPYILDGLFGVVLPYSYAAARRHPEWVFSHYRRVTLADSPTGQYGVSLGRTMVGIYSEHALAFNFGSATPRTSIIEPIAYVLKWVIPGLLMSFLLAAVTWHAIPRPRHSVGLKASAGTARASSAV